MNNLEQQSGAEDLLSFTEFAPRVFPDVIVDRAGDYLFLLHPAEPRWALTNETGIRMAELLDGTRTLADVARVMAKEYAVPAEVIEPDLRRFALQLHQCNLLENLPARDVPPDTRKQRPPSLTIYVTEQCNLRCKHCAIVEGRMPPTLITNEEIFSLIDEHTRMHENPTVAFLGGEPFMRKECIEFIEYASKRTTAVNVSTNGYFVTPDLARRLAASGITVQVSLDGADPAMHDFIRGSGAFEKAWRAIEMLCEAGAAPRVNIASALTRCVLPQVKDLIARCDALGIGKVRFLPLNKTKAALTNWDVISPDPQQLKEVVRYLIFDARLREGAVTEVAGSFPGFVPDPPPAGQHWCPLGKTMIVDSQGEVYNCPSLTASEVTIGNVKRTPLEEIANGERNQASRKMMLERRFSVPECRVCAWRNFCQGGCMAFMAHQSGSVYINDEFCEFRRDLYREHAIRKAQ